MSRCESECLNFVLVYWLGLHAPCTMHVPLPRTRSMQAASAGCLVCSLMHQPAGNGADADVT